MSARLVSARFSLMRKIVILSVAILALGSAGMVGADVAQSGGKTVKALNYEFSPKVVRVSKGSTVTWVFKEGAHNVVGKGWGSSKIRSSGSWSHRFKSKGRYTYSCTLHQGMNGTVKVG